jgi:hypothetical protein
MDFTQGQEPFVKNAASKKQVESAEARQRRLQAREVSDMREILSTSSGRRFLWNLMAKCKTFESVFETSSRIAYNAGQQDIGHFLLAKIDEADAAMFFKMREENKNI